MVKPVLIAVDGTSASAQALDQGLAAAKRRGARAIVCHVIPDLVRVRALFPHLESSDSLDSLSLERKVRDALGGWLAERGVADGDVSLRIESGDAFTRVLELADAEDASLIVLGSTPRPGDVAITLGSTAERVLRHAKVPVLIARESPAQGVVLATTDLSEPSEPALYAADEMARTRGLQLAALVVVDSDAEMQTLSFLSRYSARAGEALLSGFDRLVADADLRLAALLDRLGIQARRDVRTGVATTLIARHAREQGASLVVVATHGATGLSRVLVGSVAETVARSAPCSVLVVRAAAE
jgi:nucleotide-binding universal stress UspA family protein